MCFYKCDGYTKLVSDKDIYVLKSSNDLATDYFISGVQKFVYVRGRTLRGRTLRKNFFQRLATHMRRCVHGTAFHVWDIRKSGYLAKDLADSTVEWSYDNTRGLFGVFRIPAGTPYWVRGSWLNDMIALSIEYVGPFHEFGHLIDTSMVDEPEDMVVNGDGIPRKIKPVDPNMEEEILFQEIYPPARKGS